MRHYKCQEETKEIQKFSNMNKHNLPNSKRTLIPSYQPINNKENINHIAFSYYSNKFNSNSVGPDFIPKEEPQIQAQRKSAAQILQESSQPQNIKQLKPNILHKKYVESSQINNIPGPNIMKRYENDKKINEDKIYNISSNIINYEIKKAINNLTNAVKGLDGLKQSITNNKTEFNSFLPRISSMRIKIFNDLHKYHLTIYQLIPRKFQPVKFYDTNFQEFIKRYILTEPFISFEDIYDPNPDTNKKIKTMIIDYYQKSQRLNYKNLLLFGPNGSGKTLAVHALANSLNGKVAQLEGLELFKIPSFSLEFVKISFNYMQFKPLIVYIKNIEKMFSNMNNFNFIYDKVCSSKIDNIILIASTSILENQLPKEISQKFHYTYCIRPCEKNQKINLIKFICHKIGIALNAIDKDINEFVYKNLGNYSNEDIFNLIVAAIDCKKNKIGKGENILEQVYKEGINLEDIYNAINLVKGSMTPIVMKNYYL